MDWFTYLQSRQYERYDIFFIVLAAFRKTTTKTLFSLKRKKKGKVDALKAAKF
jgi:hypothetical protein